MKNAPASGARMMQVTCSRQGSRYMRTLMARIAKQTYQTTGSCLGMVALALCDVGRAVVTDVAEAIFDTAAEAGYRRCPVRATVVSMAGRS